MRKLLVFILGWFNLAAVYAQVITTDPVFPTAGANDSISIFYNASQGNAALTGVTPVYMHAGVITNLSTSSTDWRYVVTTWGVTTDADAAMTYMGNNIWKKRYHVRNFYGVPGGETILKLAFVFRNGTGSIVGKNADGSDIFVDIVQSSGTLLASIVSPGDYSSLKNINDVININAYASATATLTLKDNGNVIATGSGTQLQHNLTVTTTGNHKVIFEANNGTSISKDSFIYVVTPAITSQNPPAGTLNGINYVGTTSATLRLFAPNKQNVYVLGDFNNWELNTAYLMNRSTDGNTWWITLNGLTAGQNYAFQYLVDGAIKIADPYSELVLDPNNDPYIPAVTYPNIPAYPTGKTTGICSVLQPGATPYNWQTTNFTAPAKEKLVVYELLLRDFIARHDYQTLKDTLDYIQNLGINAIQLMPVNEYEGNLSWGYNPSFHAALDKYYGTKNAFKAFIDECHSRGIAVILDVVYNHAFSQSPLCQLYWDNVNFKPSSDNPWLNPDARHPFNVGYDFNHDSQATRDWLDRVMRYWITEYKIDGYRFDLSKGFTQTNSGGNVGMWGQYDASRIFNIKRIADVCQAAKPGFYAILEHFADNSEETELANYGLMFWGNGNCVYSQAAMGYPSGPCNWDLNWAANYKARNWNNPNLVSYMESHDEERAMFKNLTYGNSNTATGYNIKSLGTALDRIELAHCFLIPVPGPKMIYQFGELGYDKTIELCPDGTTNSNCRTDQKPILWSYFGLPDRKQVYKVVSALNKLKQTYPVFSTTNYTMDLGGQFKRITLNNNLMNVDVLGNFGVASGDINPYFQHTGRWYEYFSGDSLDVTNVNALVNLQAGEYRLYTDVKINTTPIVSNQIVNNKKKFDMIVFPNPAEDMVNIKVNVPKEVSLKLSVFDINGRVVAVEDLGTQQAGEYQATWNLSDLSGTRVPTGVYFSVLEADGGKVGMQKIMVY